MRIDEPPLLPNTIGGLLLASLACYRRRFVLYTALALAVFALEYLVAVPLARFLPSGALLWFAAAQSAHQTIQLATAVIADAFVIAAVAIGVASDLTERGLLPRALLLAASERWGVVTIATFILFMVQFETAPAVFTSDIGQTAYGLFILPVLVFWGAVSLAQTVAAIEPARSRLLLPLIALGKGPSVALRPVNLLRLAFLSLLLAVPMLLQTALYGYATAAKLPDAFFWANVPLDLLTLGPLQAISTAMYLDFLRRAARR